ncbi:N-acyl-D-amino-acid deacylase family protein [Frankia sp. Cas3]|uniref:N-acyl-D-amino-acid deacylase family protein n=1 Tax=Frankia sp. Cas3 TaxID=3073926 RepID=UPI002AD40FC9|nr:amidohydrolase family protein [Frankia sp. Cas3]
MSCVLIHGGTVVDGTGAAAYGADVRVRDGVITEVGPGLRAEGGDEQTLDASGAYVAPGFIDAHTHLDPSLFWDPLCDPMPQHGVTTVVTGNCSLSLAPLRPQDRQAVTTIFAFVEDIPREAFEQAVPWSWSTFAEFRDCLVARGGTAVNAAYFVGHTPLRMFVMGDAAWERAATAAEREQLAAVLDDCLRAGAFGLSTSMFDEDPTGRPVPSVLADDAEHAALIDVLARYDAPLEFIPRQQLRYMAGDVGRFVELCAPRGVASSWLGIYHNERSERAFHEMLDRAAAWQNEGIRVYPQVTPRTMDVRPNFFGGMSFMNLAQGWNRAIQADEAEKRRLLADPDWRRVAREEWDTVTFNPFPHRVPDRVRIMAARRPENQPFVGRTLADLVAARGGHPSDVLADWVLEEDLVPDIVGVGLSNYDPDGVAALLRHPGALVSNSDAGAHLTMFCAAGDTTLLLARHVRERGDFTVEEAVHALTGRQADAFNLSHRGRIAPGLAGDLTVFALADLAWEPDSFVADLPGGGKRLRRPAGGFRHTVVAGTVTQSEGTLTGARPGGFVGRGEATPV